MYLPSSIHLSTFSTSMSSYSEYHNIQNLSSEVRSAQACGGSDDNSRSYAPTIRSIHHQIFYQYQIPNKFCMYYERGKHFSKFSFALFLVFCLFMKVLLHEQNKYMYLFSMTFKITVIFCTDPFAKLRGVSINMGLWCYVCCTLSHAEMASWW